MNEKIITNIKKDMYHQLKIKGQLNDYSKSKIDEYVTYYKSFILCKESIEKYGVMIEKETKDGGITLRKNPVLGEMARLTNAMETISRGLGIRVIDIKIDDTGVGLSLD